MVSANFPEKGAQARRKVDGLLGEIYAVDPSKDLLTVRWRTATGFLTQVCTSERLAHDWELTVTTSNLPRVPLTSPEALTRQLALERQRYLLRAGGLLFICAIVLFIVYSILTPSSKTVQSNNNSQTPALAGDFYSIAVPPGTITLTADQLSMAYSDKSKVFTNRKKRLLPLPPMLCIRGSHSSFQDGLMVALTKILLASPKEGLTARQTQDQVSIFCFGPAKNRS